MNIGELDRYSFESVVRRIRKDERRKVIEELARELSKGPPLARVDDVAVAWRPPSGRFTAFGIRYAEFDS